MRQTLAALLEKDADPEEIGAWLDSRNPKEVSDDLVPVLKIFEQLQKLQEREIKILAKCFQVRQELTENLIELILEDPKDVKEDASEPLQETGSDQAEGTKPISTDQ